MTPPRIAGLVLAFGLIPDQARVSDDAPGNAVVTSRERAVGAR